MTEASGPVRAELREDGRVLHLLLDAPKGNILDARMIGALAEALARHGSSAALRAIVLEGAGAHFSFGASVAEHTRVEAPAMLAALHDLFRSLSALALPTVAVVRGACLGGGLELAAWCSWIFAAPDATFGQPEIKLAVFPPMASLVLPWRLGGGRALDLCVSGRTMGAEEARAVGLVHAIDPRPDEAARAFVAENLLPRSGASLRFAERAVRAGLAQLMVERLPMLERVYLEELMQTHDANEGIVAFLERRAPQWAA